jgi:putative transcriptional regulator
MTNKSESSRTLTAIHETAQDLHHAGFIDKRRMRRFDALGLDPIPPYTREHIRALRDRYRLSQAVLASVLNTSASTVRQWEIRARHPIGPSFPAGTDSEAGPR